MPNREKSIIMPQNQSLKFNVRKDRWYVFKKRVPLSEPETIVEPFQGHQLDEAISELPEGIGTELFISRIKFIAGTHIPAFHAKNPMVM